MAKLDRFHLKDTAPNFHKSAFLQILSFVPDIPWVFCKEEQQWKNRVDNQISSSFAAAVESPSGDEVGAIFDTVKDDLSIQPPSLLLF